MAAQAIVAQVEGLIERIRQCGYQVKHRKTLAHSHDELLGLEVMDKGDSKSGTERYSPNWTWFTQGKVVNGIKNVKLRVE